MTNCFTGRCSTVNRNATVKSKLPSRTSINENLRKVLTMLVQDGEPELIPLPAEWERGIPRHAGNQSDANVVVSPWLANEPAGFVYCFERPVTVTVRVNSTLVSPP